MSDANFVLIGLVVDQPLPRLGLAIGKKVANRAVDRNRLKRLIRETFRCSRPVLPRDDFVVLARNGAKTLSTAAIRHSLTRLWRRHREKYRDADVGADGPVP